MKEARQKEFSLYKITRNVKEPLGKERRSVIAWGPGDCRGVGKEGRGRRDDKRA